MPLRFLPRNFTVIDKGLCLHASKKTLLCHAGPQEGLKIRRGGGKLYCGGHYLSPLVEILLSALQSLTVKYRGLQGNTCNENRDPAMRTGVPCNENRFFPLRIDLQGVPCKPYRIWVCNVICQHLGEGGAWPPWIRQACHEPIVCEICRYGCENHKTFLV